MMACFLTWKMLLTIIRRRAIKHWNFWTLVEFSKFHFCLKKKEMVLIIIIRKRSREILVNDVISSPSTLGASPHWGMDWRGLVIQRVFRSEINMLDSFVWPLYRPHEAGGAGGAVAPPIYFQYSIVPISSAHKSILEVLDTIRSVAKCYMPYFGFIALQFWTWKFNMQFLPQKFGLFWYHHNIWALNRP